MNRNVKAVLAAAIGAIAFAGIARQSKAAGFTAGDLVVYQVGDGSAALSSVATAVFLDDYSTSGTLNYSLEMPTATGAPQNPLTASGTATSEGGLTLSTNGQYLVVPGYDSPTGTTGVASTATTSIPREVGLVDLNSNINDATTTTAFSANNIRSAVSDGTNVWMAGANSGVVATTVGGSGAGTSVSTASGTTSLTNLRQLEIDQGQLYIGTGSGSAARIATVGTGMPITGPQSMTNLTGLPITTNDASTGPLAGPYGFAFATLGAGSAADTLYVADNGNGSSSTTAGTIDKFSLVSGNWTLTGTVPLVGLSGLAIESTPTCEELFATTPTNIYELTDSTGYDGTLSGTPTSIAAAATDEAFRGIVILPASPAPEPASLGVLSLGGAALLARRRRRLA